MVDAMVAEVLGFSGIIPPDGSVREAFQAVSAQLFKHRETVTLVEFGMFLKSQNEMSAALTQLTKRWGREGRRGGEGGRGKGAG